MNDPTTQLEEFIALLKELTHQRFYGALTLKLEAGKIVLLKKEETLKPTDLSGHPRSQNATNKA